jgi:hypothetical protein
MAASPDRVCIVGVGDNATSEASSDATAERWNRRSLRCSVALGVKKRVLMRSIFTKERTAPLRATFASRNRRRRQ